MPAGPRILYGVSSVGLGHARRSVQISEEILRLYPELPEIDWISAEPALSFLEKKGKKPLEISRHLTSLSSAMELQSEKGGISDMSKVARASSRVAKENFFLMKPYLTEKYDILIQDEFEETMFSFMWDRVPSLPSRRALITDFVSFHSQSRNPLDRVVLWYANRALKKAICNSQVKIFADAKDELEPSDLAWIEGQDMHILGPILGNAPSKTKGELRNELFLSAHIGSLQPKASVSNGNLVVFTVGGTSIGEPLLQFVMHHAAEISKALGGALLIVLTGPRLWQDPAEIASLESSNLRIIPFTPDVQRYFKAADCVVAQAGASTLHEVAMLGTPCVCIPIKNHWEQEANAKRFSRSHGFRVLHYNEISVGSLSREIKNATDSGPGISKSPLPNSAAPSKAAQLICSLFSREEPH